MSPDREGTHASWLARSMAQMHIFVRVAGRLGAAAVAELPRSAIPLRAARRADEPCSVLRASRGPAVALACSGTTVTVTGTGLPVGFRRRAHGPSGPCASRRR